MASNCANGSSVLASNQYQLTVSQYAKLGLTITQPSPTTLVVQGLSESQLLEFQLYSYIYSANFNAYLTLSSATVTYSPLSYYVPVPGLTCMLQEAIVLTNSSNTSTMGSIITPFSQPLFNGGTMNACEITDTLTNFTMTMAPSLGCEKFYTLTFTAANRNVVKGSASSRGNNRGAYGMAIANGAAKGVRVSVNNNVQPQVPQIINHVYNTCATIVTIHGTQRTCNPINSF